MKFIICIFFLAISSYADNTIRRLYLDLFERTPTLAEYQNSQTTLKTKGYDFLVYELMKQDDFYYSLSNRIIEHYLGELDISGKARYKLQKHIVDKYLKKEKDFRVFINDVITAKGTSEENPLVYFYSSNESIENLTSRITNRVISYPLECAQCHDHKKYKDIKQQHFWAAASLLDNKRVFRLERAERKRIFENPQKAKDFLGDEGYKSIQKLLKGSNEMIEDRNSLVVGEEKAILNELEMEYEYNGKTFRTKPMLDNRVLKGSKEIYPSSSMANWIVKNKYFAKATANWIFYDFTGTTIADTVFDLYKNNNRFLTSYANHFTSQRYNIVYLVRFILKSKAYRLKNNPKMEPLEFKNFKSRRIRTLSGTQLFQTLLKNKYQEAHKNNTSLEDLEKMKKRFIGDIFKKKKEDTNENYTSTLSQELFLLNNNKVNNYINAIAKQYHKDQKNLTKRQLIRKIIIEFYTREPTEKEYQFLEKMINNTRSYNSSYYEVIWLILKSPEMRIY